MTAIAIHHFDRAEQLFEYVAPWSDGTGLERCVFRGHSQENYALVPTALRASSFDTMWQVAGLQGPDGQQRELLVMQIEGEFQALRSFYRLADRMGLAVPISPRMRHFMSFELHSLMMSPSSESEPWMPADLHEAAALAQHYGIPTRLLDWSYDINIALYFALHGALSKHGNIAIWCINKDYLGIYGRHVVSFVTPHYAGNPNLNAQKGLFTLSNFSSVRSGPNAAWQLVDRRPLDQVIIAGVEAETTLFHKLTLPCDEAAKGCAILERMGYGAARINPGYAGVAAQLKSLKDFSVWRR